MVLNFGCFGQAADNIIFYSVTDNPSMLYYLINTTSLYPSNPVVDTVLYHLDNVINCSHDEIQKMQL